jgi:hypothetical protein
MNIAALFSDPTMQVVGALTAIGTFLTLVFKSVKTWRAFKRKWRTNLDNFFADWNGTPDRAGVPGREGVLVRMQTIEQGQQATADELAEQSATLREIVTVLAKQGDKIDAINHELHPNSGKSMRDDLNRLIARTGVTVNDTPPESTERRNTP